MKFVEVLVVQMSFVINFTISHFSSFLSCNLFLFQKCQNSKQICSNARSSQRVLCCSNQKTWLLHPSLWSFTPYFWNIYPYLFLVQNYSLFHPIYWTFNQKEWSRKALIDNSSILLNSHYKILICGHLNYGGILPFWIWLNMSQSFMNIYSFFWMQ